MKSDSTHWSRDEVEATVTSYLQMWLMEQAGQPYSKTEHRRALLPLLFNRSDAAVELKHQNISAILMEHGWQNIPGYRPRGNYQKLLAEVVASRIMHDRQFDVAAERAADLPAVLPLISSFDDVLVESPRLSSTMRSDPTSYVLPQYANLKRDYLDREARNSSLGKAGELFAVSFEQQRLRKLGKEKLADQVEQVSETKGDGLGYDVLSFEESGRERFIEVKTTAWSKETPFFISRNELEFSKSFTEQYHLYRVFDFRKAPHMFDLRGSVERSCLLDPVTYRGKFT